MPISAYMARCLFDPVEGYYATRPALGPAGDFVTAPGLSQMFGEMVGLFVISAWTALGSPSRWTLVEIGPGDGGLMEDLLRALRAAPAARAGMRLDLIEPSPVLRAAQIERLSRLGLEVAHIADLEATPGDQPLIVVANEVLDCLPADQFELGPEGWLERRVGLDRDGRLMIGLTPCPPPLDHRKAARAKVGEVYEISAAQCAFSATTARALIRRSGVGLFIDYGRDVFGPGDTLQAVRGHRKVGPLEDPGGCDLTVWADFPAVTAAARAEGALVSGPISQSDFLRRFGIGARAEKLMQARPDLKEALQEQMRRLTAPDEMGELFKVMAVHFPELAFPLLETSV